MMMMVNYKCGICKGIWTFENIRRRQGATKRFSLFGLTNSVLVYDDRLERKRQNTGGAGYH
jgi:hypothetical protein